MCSWFNDRIDKKKYHRPLQPFFFYPKFRRRMMRNMKKKSTRRSEGELIRIPKRKEVGQQQQQQKVCRALSIAPDDDKVKEFVPPEAIRQPSLDHLSEHIWKYSKSPLASSFCCREEMPIRNCKSTARRKEQQHKNAECPPIFRTELTTISGPKKFKC